MSTQSLQVLQSSLPAVPVAMVLAGELLLHETSSSAPPSGPSDEDENALIFRATHVTATLKHIQGYEHYGIND